MLKSKYSDKYGLYNGKMGLCLFAFLKQKLTDDHLMKKEAENLLTEICDNIDQVADFDFSSGLTGIGWSIEWILQNKYLDGNSSEILEDLDDEVYKLVVFSKCDNITLEKGTLGRAFYFYKRLESNNWTDSRYRKICIMECLVLLTDELCDWLLTNDCSTDNPSNLERIFTVARCLFFLPKLLSLRVNTEKVRATIYEKFNWVLNNKRLTQEGQFSILWYSFAYAARQLKEKNLENFARLQIAKGKNLNLSYVLGSSETFVLISNLTNDLENANVDNWQEAWLLC